MHNRFPFQLLKFVRTPRANKRLRSILGIAVGSNMAEATDNEGVNPLFEALDKCLEENTQVTLEQFWSIMVNTPDRDKIFPTECIDSVFAVLCTDEKHDHLVITEQSYKRAKKVFKFEPKHFKVTDKLLGDIFQAQSIDDNFFGFISEDVAKKILSETQWLVRCDEEGFIITRAVRPANPDSKVGYENYRVTYDETTSEYIWYFKEEVLRFSDWEPIQLKMRTFSVDTWGSPLLHCCEDSLLYNWREGTDDIIDLWTGLVSRRYNIHLHCLRWFVATITINDPDTFFHTTLSQCFDNLYYANKIIDAIDLCLEHGADLNNTKYCPLYNFACYATQDHADTVANHIWRIGGDPNAKKDGVPVFFYTAKKNNRAKVFTLNPKLDINIEDNNGHNVAWHCGHNIDLAVFNDKRLNIHQVKNGKTLMDRGIEDFQIPYILKLISVGIDVKIPSATKAGTYLHAFLTLAKKGKDAEIITVIRALIEAGIGVQELNPFYLTALHIAAAVSTPTVVRSLIVDFKANPNGHQESDSTPLHVAAERGDADIVKTLLELGADQSIRNTRGQLPREVALYAVKTLFGKNEAIPDYKFRGIKVAVTNPVHPQCQANAAVVGDYLYIDGGVFPFLDWWDDYGYQTIQCFINRVEGLMRLPISNISDNSKQRTWEVIPPSALRYQSTYATFFKANNTLWFNGEKDYALFNTESQEWTKGPPRQPWQIHNHLRYPYYNYYENKVMAPSCTEIIFMDKTTGTRDTLKIERGDFASTKDDDGHNGVLQDNIYWFVSQHNRKILYALNIELRRIFKVFEFDFFLTSTLVCFGNRFLMTTIVINDNTDLRLLILDTQTMQHSLHEFEFDIDPEKDFNLEEDSKTGKIIVQGGEVRYKDEMDKGKPLFANKKLPIRESALAIYQSTLLIHGGRFADLLPINYLMAVDLSQLVPYLSLEQHCALAISKNKDKIDKERLELVSGDLKIKIGLD